MDQALANDAAIRLLEQIGAPKSMLNIWVWHNDNDIKLIVRIDKNYPLDLSKIPSIFEGFPVEIETRDTPKIRV